MPNTEEIRDLRLRKKQSDKARITMLEKQVDELTRQVALLMEWRTTTLNLDVPWEEFKQSMAAEIREADDESSKRFKYIHDVWRENYVGRNP